MCFPAQFVHPSDVEKEAICVAITSSNSVEFVNSFAKKITFPGQKAGRPVNIFSSG